MEENVVERSHFRFATAMADGGRDQELNLLAEWDREDDVLALKNRWRKTSAFVTQQLHDHVALLDRYERDFNQEHDSWDALALRHAKQNWIELHRRLLWLQEEHNAFIADYQSRVHVIRAGQPSGSPLIEDREALPSADAVARTVSKLEQWMLSGFYNGNMRAMKHELYPQSEEIAIWSGFYFGQHFGMMVVLFIWVIWDSVIDDSKNHNLWESSVFALYRGIGVLILLLWCWCFQVYVYNWFNIPFLSIFDWKVTKSTQFVVLVRHAVSVTIIYLINLLLYYKALRGDIPHLVPPYIFPLLLFLFLLYILIFPLKQRRSLGKTVCRVISAPCAIVRFREAYLGDIFTSLVRVFVDLAWSGCYFFSGAFVEEDPRGNDICTQSGILHWIVVPLLSALPLWWRFCQNIRKYRETHNRFPYIPNAMKYACAQSVVLFATFHPHLKQPDDHMTTYQWFYLAACAITTMYQYFWDVYMDWGLGGVGGLRNLRLYPNWMYYSAMVVDFFLRFCWTFTLIPPQGYGPFPSNVQIYLNPILASVEVIRRSMWGLFRVEYEHTFRLLSSQKSIASTTSEEESDDEDEPDEKYSFWVLIEISVVVAVVVVVACIAVLTRSKKT
ncbi:unnamed protein product [Aphanomyces euteiches]